MDHLCYLCLVFVMLSRLFIAALWSPAGKGLTSWFLLVMSNCDCGILGQVWYLSVLIPEFCRLSYSDKTSRRLLILDSCADNRMWAYWLSAFLMRGSRKCCQRGSNYDNVFFFFFFFFGI